MQRGELYESQINSGHPAAGYVILKLREWGDCGAEWGRVASFWGGEQNNGKTTKNCWYYLGGDWSRKHHRDVCQVGSGRELLETFGMIFNFVLFIIPGLLLAGLGAIIAKNKQPMPVAQWQCPHCQTTYAQTPNFCTAFGEKSDLIARMVASPEVRP